MNFYSRGKFLISGEYLVMKGASALTVPLQKGQTLSVELQNEPGIIRWTSLEYGKIWFSCTINFTLFEVMTGADDRKAQFLARLLKSAHDLNRGFLSGNHGYVVTTDLEFNLDWGFGSSSSLISNVAYWANVDPFDLHRRVSEGSGYDVVCARHDQPLIFTHKTHGYEIETVDFKPQFRAQIFFIYLGSKQDSSASVRSFLQKKGTDQGLISEISQLSKTMASTEDIVVFNNTIRSHDQIISNLLSQPRLKESRFPELDGEVKPLGAWGGDFAMLTFGGDRSELVNYLKQKGISVIFSFDEIVKTK
jgi:mevalonate kinase